MNNQMIKSLVIFFVIVAVLFYGAYSIAPEGEKELQGGGHTGTFLDLVQALQGIDFDLAFIATLPDAPIPVQRSVVRESISPSQVGRPNPFAPATNQNRSLSFSESGSTPPDVPEPVDFVPDEPDSTEGQESSPAVEEVFEEVFEALAPPPEVLESQTIILR